MKYIGSKKVCGINDGPHYYCIEDCKYQYYVDNQRIQNLYLACGGFRIQGKCYGYNSRMTHEEYCNSVYQFCKNIYDQMLQLENNRLRQMYDDLNMNPIGIHGKIIFTLLSHPLQNINQIADFTDNVVNGWCRKW